MDEGEAREVVVRAAQRVGVRLELVRWVPKLNGWAVIAIDGHTAYVLDSAIRDIDPAVLELAAGYAAVRSQDWISHSVARANPSQMAGVSVILVVGVAAALTTGALQSAILGISGVFAVISYLVWIGRRHDPMFLKALNTFGDPVAGRRLIELFQRRARENRTIESLRRWPEVHHLLQKALRRYERDSAVRSAS